MYYTPDNITETIRTYMRFDSDNFANRTGPAKPCWHDCYRKLSMFAYSMRTLKLFFGTHSWRPASKD